MPIGQREFVKMSGSGNDFVMVDARSETPGELADAAVISRICARGTGIGADGIVFLLPSDQADLKLLYLNADGSVGDLCGNATLCMTRLAVRLHAASPTGMTIETGAGIIHARLLATGEPEIDLEEVVDVRAVAEGIPVQLGERRMGFAMVGGHRGGRSRGSRRNWPRQAPPVASIPSSARRQRQLCLARRG
jgi:diaminopimelate epimerase